MGINCKFNIECYDIFRTCKWNGDDGWTLRNIHEPWLERFSCHNKFCVYFNANKKKFICIHITHLSNKTYSSQTHCCKHDLHITISIVTLWAISYVVIVTQQQKKIEKKSCLRINFIDLIINYHMYY